MRLSFVSILAFICTFVNGQLGTCDNTTSNNCITFSVTQGTGCAWMCNYCASQLATNNYYFTDNVCTYQEGQGCVGNPIAGKQYTCCSTTF